MRGVVEMSATDLPESRLGLSEVSEEISRVFFGKGMESSGSYYQPPSDGYGVPQGPLLDGSRSLYRGNTYFYIQGV